ncbi:L-fucose:H+ symporter permease [Altererythrobacter lutimaris]|uniref:L-fucose:H+ symporter permease n=1 Tax=Altererythrobacter lutimaris TaxID=2743979 RepID=A0A850HH78_9SPHN|nr:L-fucose:H+ symporter permease [Altererythrobacter lutimaris]NVE94372.1 L-fucose:H+ symporter permease [Altererythrobacter lutimaris]
MQRWIYKGFTVGFFAVASLFLLWALANSLNDILIRQFQKALDLSRGESGFLQFVFYLGYFFFALPAGFLIERLGYRAGILIGLGLYAIGALAFYPAAEIREFWAFLAALFVIASGLAILETAANPMIARFGPSDKSAQRLNLAQSLNGLGAFVAPVIGGLFIFSGIELETSQIEAMSAAELDDYRASEARMVQAPYLALAAAIGLVAAILAYVRLPIIDHGTENEETLQSSKVSLTAPLKVTHLRRAIVAQFFYVGAQVVIWSYFVDFAIDVGVDISEKTAAFLLSLSIASFMAGRFIGTWLMSWIAPAKLLALFAVMASILSVCAVALDGEIALAALGATSFFMSIMFPTIFALGLEGLGEHTKIGSSYLIMAIIGGALFPPAAGYIADATGNIQLMAAPAVISFIVVALFAMGCSRRS